MAVVAYLLEGEMARGDKDFTIDNDFAGLFTEPIPAEVRAGLCKMNVPQLLALTAYVRRQLTHARWQGEDDGKEEGKFKAGQLVRAVKWRDNGETAETLYYGEIVGFKGTDLRIKITHTKRA